MRREDEALLAYFRQKPCEACSMSAFSTQPHHIHCRGLGGGSRLDVALNLIALCATCHYELQEGKENRDKCLEIVARREGLESGEVVWDAILRLLRQPKGAS